MKRVALLSLLVIAACGGGGGGGGKPPPPPPPANDSPGGIWTGVRPNGTPIVVLISEAGEIRILDEFGNQGFGTVQVTNRTNITATYQIAPPFGGTVIDGSDSATCGLTGTLQERVSIEYQIDCTTSLGTPFGGAITLTYSAAYDTDSSLVSIAGQYDADGDVLTIDAAGAVFLQGSQTGCVVNGQVSVLQVEWNLYAVTALTENCQPPYDALNGASWEGLGTVVPEVGADTLVSGLTTVVGGLPVSLVLVLPRL